MNKLPKQPKQKTLSVKEQLRLNVFKYVDLILNYKYDSVEFKQFADCLRGSRTAYAEQEAYEQHNRDIKAAEREAKKFNPMKTKLTGTYAETHDSFTAAEQIAGF